MLTVILSVLTILAMAVISHYINFDNSPELEQYYISQAELVSSTLKKKE